MDDDDLPLANYLLQGNDEDEDELWESDADFDEFDSETPVEIYDEDEPIDVEDLDTDDRDSVEVDDGDSIEVNDGDSIEVNDGDSIEVVEEKGSPAILENVSNECELVKKNLSEVLDKNDDVDFEKTAVYSYNQKQEPKERKPTDGSLIKENIILATPSKSVKTEIEFKKTKAIKAKEQRERKKKYIQELNDTVETLQREKASFQRVTSELNSAVEELKAEISYLKGVIANQSELALILKSVANTPGIELSCSFLQDGCSGSPSNNREVISGKKNKRKYSAEVCGKHEGKAKQGKVKRNRVNEDDGEHEGNNAGVCVHVQKGKVTLEFCGECSKKASHAGVH